MHSFHKDPHHSYTIPTPFQHDCNTTEAHTRALWLELLAAPDITLCSLESFKESFQSLLTCTLLCRLLQEQLSLSYSLPIYPPKTEKFMTTTRQVIVGHKTESQSLPSYQNCTNRGSRLGSTEKNRCEGLADWPCNIPSYTNSPPVNCISRLMLQV